jgi:hypothetical protein
VIASPVECLRSWQSRLFRLSIFNRLRLINQL